MAHHVLHLPDLDPSAATLVVGGEEAAHAARAKRVRPGERVLVLDGRGLCVETEVVEARRELTLRVLEFRRAERVAPAVHVFAATPKGPRVSDMVDALSQVGAASWRPLVAERQASEPTEAKLDRLERVTIEAMKQSRRAWPLELGRPAEFEEALRAPAGELVVVADAVGKNYAPSAKVETVRLLIGPEGGWSERERERVRASGAVVASFGPHVMRIETAAAAACAIVLHAHGGAAKPGAAPAVR